MSAGSGTGTPITAASATTTPIASTYREYATVVDVRASYLGGQQTTADTEILRSIRECSDLIESAAGHRRFVPRIETRYFDYDRHVDSHRLRLEEDLLAITTLTNGDATTIASTKYVLMPRNDTPYWAIDLLGSSGAYWTYSTDPEKAISLLGIWGYHKNYADAWEQIDTLAADATASATTLTMTAGAGNAGELWKIDSEYLYLSSRSTATATVVRGVNGSTGATHTGTTTHSSVYRWVPDRKVSGLCISASAAMVRIREQGMNPTPEIIVIDGRSFQTVKDVRQYIYEEVASLGLSR